MSEAHPHSIAIWIRLEKLERMSDGNLSGMPTEVKKCTGRIHLSNGEEASKKLESFTQTLKDLIEKENEIGNSL